MVTSTNLKVDSNACSERTVLLTVHLLDCANDKVEIIKAWEVIGRQVLAPGNCDHNPRCI